MEWKAALSRLIADRWQAGEVFTVSQAYEFEAQLKLQFPGNAHIKEKIRQVLQQLRDDQVLSFLDNAGTYVVRGPANGPMLYPDQLTDVEGLAEGARCTIVVNACKRILERLVEVLTHIQAR